jgi:glutathione S-transferase
MKDSAYARALFDAEFRQLLQTHDFFAAGQYSIADIALYAYTHVAEDGEFDLSDFPRVNGWMKRVQDQPGHVRMDWRP